MTTIWSLVNSSHSYLNYSHFYIESKYVDFSPSIQGITKLVAYDNSAFMLTKHFRS
jgi:hypothetical protein